MMKPFILLLSISCLAMAHGLANEYDEFGRAAVRKDRVVFDKQGSASNFNSKKRKSFSGGRKGKNKSNSDKKSMEDWQKLAQEYEIVLHDFSLPLSMSYGDSPSLPTGGFGVVPPTGSTKSPDSNPSTPTFSTPSVSNPSRGDIPSFSPVQAPSIGTTSPTTGLAPNDTKAPSSVPDSTGETLSPGLLPTNVPSSGVSPTIAISPTTVFDLSEESGSVVVVGPPHAATTVVRLEIGYLVEAFGNSTSIFEDDINWSIFVTSVKASLNSNSSGVLDGLAPSRRLEGSSSQKYSTGRKLLASSTFSRSCNSTVVGATCFIMEADIVYILNGNMNAEYSAYLAYLSLHREMGTFDEGLPLVARVEYLSPLPILPPVSIVDPANSGDEFLTPGDSSISFNPYTVGAAVAMCTGGLMALLVWNRNRRTRNSRHMMLEEVDCDSPDTSPASSPRDNTQREVVSHPL